MMRSIQFDIIVETERDADLWVMPAEIYQQVMNESAPLSNFANEVVGLVEQIMRKRCDTRLTVLLLEDAFAKGVNEQKNP